MNKKKTLDELTLMDDYMFAAVKENTEFLRPLLEFILGVKIKKIEFTEPQKTEKKGYQSEERRREYMMLNMRDNEIREEGREEGKILQAIKMYRDLVHYSDEQIIETVMKEFKLKKKDAESYLKPAFA